MKTPGTVLIIDDEKKLNDLLGRIIRLEGFEVYQAYNAKDGKSLLAAKEIDVVFCDVRLPDANGVQLVAELKLIRPEVEIINLTAFGAIKDGIQAVRNGAYDYLVKGDDNDRMLPLLYQAAGLAMKKKALQRKRTAKKGLTEIIGISTAIKAALVLAKKVAPLDTTVLLLGETGTGKEVFARAIHSDSIRNEKPFVAINCSSFSSDLLESELFGYKQGAFTGALKDKKGLLEEASGGTIFLDEIGEMSVTLQAKLLRVLEDKTFIKLGDTTTQKMNARIIAATNRNLESESEKGNFRSDLYYRLSVFSIELPPLRERGEDVKLLAIHYLEEFSVAFDKPGLFLSEQFLSALQARSWKGNIRELKNTMERITILTDVAEILPSLLPVELTDTGEGSSQLDMQSVERRHISRVLQHTDGNKTEAARLLGIGLTTLYRKITEYNL